MEASDIGKLIDLAIRRRHESYRGFADRNSPLNVKTLMSAIRSERKPIVRSKSLIEQGLNWMPGTIDWLWANHESLELGDLDPSNPLGSGRRALEQGSPEVPERRASDLSNEELFAEVTYRMRRLLDESQR